MLAYAKRSPGRATGPWPTRNANQLAGHPPAARLAQRPAQERRVSRVVGEPGCVREQLPHRDPVAVRDEAGQPPLDRVSEPEPLLGDELEDEDRDERLRDAAGAESIAGAERDASPKHCQAGCFLAARSAPIDEHERPRAARSDNRVERPTIRTARRCGPATARRERPGSQHGDQRQRGDPDPSHGPSVHPYRGILAYARDRHAVASRDKWRKWNSVSTCRSSRSRASSVRSTICSRSRKQHGISATRTSARTTTSCSHGPWLDGPTALAAVLAQSGQMTLATTVAVPVLRGPAATAKILAAIDVLSGGRLLVGVGPGSSARDYELVGVPFEERWKRLDEAVQALRAYWRADDVAFEGAFYSTAGFTLAPTPAQRPGPPIWIGSWGSPAGLRRVARLADGWLASGYNTTPELFAQAWADVQAELAARGRDAASVRERHRNDVVLRHGGPGTRRGDAHGRTGADARPSRWSSSGRSCRSALRRNARRSCWRTRGRARSASSCGRSPTSVPSWRPSASA